MRVPGLVLVCCGLLAPVGCDQGQVAEALIEPSQDTERDTKHRDGGDSDDPSEGDGDELSAEEEEELRRCARITDFGVEVWISSSMNEEAEFNIWTEASLCAVPPKIRHPALVQQTKDGTTTASMISDDYTLEPNGFKMEFYHVQGFWCGNLESGSSVKVDSEHYARYEYIRWGGLLNISKGPQYDSQQDSCPVKEELVEGETTSEWEEEEGCESCQQWLYYEDGELVDEWWECEPTDSSECGIDDEENPTEGH